jgi:hypothetical protein
MWKSSEGWYVRRWAAGSERVCVAVATYHPKYKLSPFITTMLDPVADLVCPCLGYVDPTASKDFFDHNFNLSPFMKGPPGDPYCQFTVTTEDEAHQVAKEIRDVVCSTVDPWLVQHRSPAAMFELVHSAWQQAGPMRDPHRGMIEISLAYLCSSPEEERLRSELTAKIQAWPARERAKVEKLTAELDRRRAATTPG